MYSKVNGEYILTADSSCENRINFCEIIAGKRVGFETMMVLCKQFVINCIFYV